MDTDVRRTNIEADEEELAELNVGDVGDEMAHRDVRGEGKDLGGWAVEVVLDDDGQPVFGPRDDADLAKVAEIGLPFWLAGGYSTAEQVRATPRESSGARATPRRLGVRIRGAPKETASSYSS